ncbi:MAG: hypothetical protein WC700_14450 [Gemmatimonadaceae bacterium]|jgi:hypothetical protein
MSDEREVAHGIHGRIIEFDSRAEITKAAGKPLKVVFEVAAKHEAEVLGIEGEPVTLRIETEQTEIAVTYRDAEGEHRRQTALEGVGADEAVDTDTGEVLPPEDAEAASEPAAEEVPFEPLDEDEKPDADAEDWVDPLALDPIAAPQQLYATEASLLWKKAQGSGDYTYHQPGGTDAYRLQRQIGEWVLTVPPGGDNGVHAAQVLGTVAGLTFATQPSYGVGVWRAWANDEASAQVQEVASLSDSERETGRRAVKGGKGAQGSSFDPACPTLEEAIADGTRAVDAG